MHLNRKISFTRVLIVLVLLLATGSVGVAQPFNNEWIDFNKTYYKFKVGADGVYRIPQTVLNENGLGQTPAEHFRLYRNGEEVILYTSIPNGPLPADGFIEFWGLANDGLPDQVLYREPQFQHRTKYNLHSDTAVYFLTVEPFQPNKRFQTIENNVAGNSLPREPYFMYRLARDFKERLNLGFAADLEQYVYSSSYDSGEFFSSNDIRQRVVRTITENNLRVAAGGPDATLRFGAFGNTTKTRRIRFAINGTQVYENAMNFFSDLVAEAPVPLSVISTGSAAVAITNVQPPAPPSGADPYVDRLTVSFYELIYPREFNFNNLRQFSFDLPVKASGHYLEISNFQSNNVAPVLYDLENRERFVANTQVSGLSRFALPASAASRKLVMVNQAPANIPTITGLEQKRFTDFSNTSLQGNYLIITNKIVHTEFNGVNPILEYSRYRNSAAGGGYTVATYDIDELVDQFAFGIQGHPLSVKNFLRYAKAGFANPIEQIFIIGKGVTYNYYRTGTAALRPRLNELNLVPTYGYPGSDNLLASPGANEPVNDIPIGRLSVIRPGEVLDYLEKVKEYEEAQATLSGRIEDKRWTKNVVHVTGATDALLGLQLCNYMNNYNNLIRDTLTGANSLVLCKTSSAEQDQYSSQVIAEKFREGLSLLTYFGHSSANTLEFNIKDPQDYDNAGKYPVFSVNGCYAGDFFQYSLGRFQVYETFTEKFILAKQRGAIAFLASTHFGVVNYLGAYLNSFYDLLGKKDYGAKLGKINRDALELMKSRFSPIDFLSRVHVEQLSLHGDPALSFNFQAKPDYAIEESLIEVSPTFISVSDLNFDVKVKYFNLGKSELDSIRVNIKRINPDGSEVVLLNEKRLAPMYADSLSFTLPIVSSIHKGQGRIVVQLDGDDAIEELFEDNNSVSKNFFIYEDEAAPFFPYNYAIVNDPAQKLYASTANPFSESKPYVMEIDTTLAFNSSLKKAVTINSTGGILEFDPGISYLDSTVYYWRTSLVPTEGGENIWNTFSFLYKVNGSSGYNQSHFFQHDESAKNRLKIAEGNKWWFDSTRNTIEVRQAVYPTSGSADADFSVIINEDEKIQSACVGSSLIFHIIDPITLIPWKNVTATGQNLFRFGSGSANCGPNRNWNFEFPYTSAVSRKRMMDMMDSIPDGYFVVVRSVDANVPNALSATWRNDTTLYGSGNSLYHKLLEAGFTTIDQVDAPKCWSLIYKKNDPSFTPVAKVSLGIYDRFFLETEIFTQNTEGTISSPSFGPAKAWNQFLWDGNGLEPNGKDEASINLIGIDTTNTQTVLKTFAVTDKSVDISDVDAKAYPYLKLVLNTKDTLARTPLQLQYWRLMYDPAPEGALSPNLYLVAKDTAEVGELVDFGIAFKNITNIPFDSVKVKFTITDANNVTKEIPFAKLNPILAKDTIRFNYRIDTRSLSGANILHLDFNPDFDQPEQFRFNNFLYRNLFVKGDKHNPLLDVTFDGVHILNGDIVSARPRIEIKLKDEAKYMLLQDTSLIRLQVKFPDGTLRTYNYGSDTVRFHPAESGADNTARIEFSPSFLTTYDQESGIDSYELTVLGKDASNNAAGQAGYTIEFKVVNKPMISNLLNYPNPFSTSTAFVFTLTGSEIPTNFKIQILTVTGKIVREITRDELGPLRIGRNITEYKWDGTDQFGQRLANGVYLYRVVSQLNGKTMEKFNMEGVNTDKFFTKGYGKMYLIR